jgi:hypothetical protein
MSLVGFGVKADVARDSVVGVVTLFGFVVTSLGTGGVFAGQLPTMSRYQSLG